MSNPPEDWVDRFDTVVKNLEINRLIANKVANFIYYEMQTAKKNLKEEVRNAIADYMQAEGCSCCRNTDDWEKAKARIAELLGVPKYSDGSGYDFSKFRTEEL
jgi:hypothetical protein